MNIGTHEDLDLKNEIKNLETSLPQTLLYISMVWENLSTYKEQIAPIGDNVVLLYDIDETLYKYTEEFENYENESVLKLYNKLREEAVASGNTEIPSLKEALKSSPLFTEIFYKYFGINAMQIEAMRIPPDYSEFVKRNDELARFLNSLPFRKWCFTNGLRSRAESILKSLGVSECFEGVICFDDLDIDMIGKPKPEAYIFVEELLGIKDKSKIYFFDDNIYNVQVAIERGWNAFLVKKSDDIISLTENELNKSIGFTAER